jgi:hypothetical protein
MIESLLLEAMPNDIRITRRLAGNWTLPHGINASGHIVGEYGTGYATYGFLYRNGTYTTLDLIGIDGAFGINASGHIVGSYLEKTPNGSRHGYFYTNGLYATLDHPSTRYMTEIKGINGAGHMVGSYSGAAGTRGFLYINGLYATIDYPSALQTNAQAINDNGQIVGWYVESYDPPPTPIHGFTASASAASRSGAATVPIGWARDRMMATRQLRSFVAGFFLGGRGIPLHSGGRGGLRVNGNPAGCWRG